MKECWVCGKTLQEGEPVIALSFQKQIFRHRGCIPAELKRPTWEELLGEKDISSATVDNE